MATGQFIEPFPSDINREAFGHWLSGFTDGEGCFQLNIFRSKRQPNSATPSARFSISLRADDMRILRLIRSFWDCGHITFKAGNIIRNTTHRGNDSYRFEVSSATHLVSTVVPHFERFNLHAKKSRDYLIWKQAVLLIDEARSNPTRRRNPRIRCHWSSDRLACFTALRDALRAVREFNAPDPLPLTAPLQPPSLFDGLD